ncbi:heme utilization protein, partial [Yersinia intermedia]|nr:heme utilization protein [Yersinia intermedia]
GATFQVLANGHDTQANAQYQWRSDQSWVTVDKAGTVTFTDMPTPTTRTVTLTATPMAGGAPLTTSLSVNRWFINAKAEKMTGPAAVAWCKAKGKGFAVPDAAVMTATTDGTPSLRTANGALWNEWGPMALYRSGWQLDNYWAAKTQGPAREMVGLVGGSFYRVPDSSLYNVTCVRSTQ